MCVPMNSLGWESALRTLYDSPHDDLRLALGLALWTACHVSCYDPLIVAAGCSVASRGASRAILCFVIDFPRKNLDQARGSPLALPA